MNIYEVKRRPSFRQFIHVLYEIEMFKVIRKPICYKRYLYDILFFVESKEEYFKFFEHMNNMSQSLKLKSVKSVNTLTF